MVGDSEVAEPLALRGVLQHRRVEVEPGEHHDPDDELRDRDEHGEGGGCLTWERCHPDHERAEQREQDEQIREHQRTAMKTTTRMTTEAAITSA